MDDLGPHLNSQGELGECHYHWIPGFFLANNGRIEHEWKTG
jgi:hypothetical protein